MTSAAVSAPVLLCLGLNCHTAPVGVRERFSVPKRLLTETLRALHALPSVQECVVLSTCNRTEIYCCTSLPEQAVTELFAHFRVEESVCSLFYRYEQEAALTHLARVASGLDSAVLGETEIFGQLKDAYEAAHEAGTTARGLNRIFQRVFSIGKKVRVAQEVAQSIGLENVEFRHAGIEEIKEGYDFAVSRAVMVLPDLVKLVRRCTQRALITLKGGDIADELKPRSCQATEVVPITKYFTEPFFETKNVLYTPLVR